MRKSIRALVALSAILLLGGQQAMASTVAIAPYSSSSTETACVPEDSFSCSASATADPRTGVIDLVAERRAAALSNGHGRSYARASIFDAIKPSRRARAITVTFTVHVESASATLTSDGATDHANATLQLFIAGPCRCPGESRRVSEFIPLADTSATTVEPSSVSDVTITRQLTLALEPGEQFGNTIFLEVWGTARGWLSEPPLVSPADRTAIGRAVMRVTSFEYQFS